MYTCVSFMYMCICYIFMYKYSYLIFLSYSLNGITADASYNITYLRILESPAFSRAMEAAFRATEIIAPSS